jgi:hypothetical protein
MESLRGQIASDQYRGSDAARLLLRAARLLEPLDAGLAREMHLDALGAALVAGDLDRPGGVREDSRRATSSARSCCCLSRRLAGCQVCSERNIDDANVCQPAP